MSTIVKLLQNVPLFSGMTTEELETIVPLLKERKYKKGTVYKLGKREFMGFMESHPTVQLQTAGSDDGAA